MAYNFNEIIGSLSLLVCCGSAILLVKLLVSSILQQEKFFSSLGKCQSELKDSHHKLEKLSALIDRRFSRIEDNASQLDPLLFNTLKEFDKITRDLRERLDDMFLPDLTEGQNNQKSSLPNENLMVEFSKLQANLEDILNQLRRNNLLSMDENAELAAMRKRIESYQSMVMKARADAKNSELAMSELRLEMQRSKNSSPSNSSEVIAENHRLQDQLQAITQEKMVLEEKVKTLTNEMQRNNIEKKFIEDRFIELT